MSATDQVSLYNGFHYTNNIMHDQPGQGQAQPVPYTMHNPTRVGYGLGLPLP